jgi:5-(carboxyamino)imidazole ribonucleotide synthase
MLNLLGDLWFREGASSPQAPDWASVLELPGTHLHLYGKAEARPGRKMGHLTVTGPALDSVRQTALDAAQRLGIAPF